MRFVLCDEDRLLRSMIESVVNRRGHEVVGVADTTAAATELVELARPDAVIADRSLGYGSDFDVIGAAAAIGARVILFSYAADASCSRHPVQPIVVAKPDLVALERAVERLEVEPDPDQGVGVGAPAGSSAVECDRRRRPTRAASGPIPMGLADARAFYEALNNAVEGDTLVALDLTGDPGTTDGTRIAVLVADIVRETDRVLASPSTVKVFLAGASYEGAESFSRRLRRQVGLSPGTELRSVVVSATETPAEAFDRLKQRGAERHLELLIA